VIVTAGWDGRIRSFQNYGLPAHQWSTWAFGESIRQLWHLTWPEEKYPPPAMLVQRVVSWYKTSHAQCSCWIVHGPVLYIINLVVLGDLRVSGCSWQEP
jgi:hypothetical protein